MKIDIKVDTIVEYKDGCKGGHNGGTMAPHEDGHKDRDK